MEDHPAGITQGMGEFLFFSSCSWGGGLSPPFLRGIAALHMFHCHLAGRQGEHFSGSHVINLGGKKPY